MNDKKCDQCRVRDAMIFDESGLPKCYECEVLQQGELIKVLRDTIAEFRSGKDIAAYDAAMREEFAREMTEVQAELERVRKERDGLAIAPLWYPSESVETPLEVALRERDEARVALDAANAALADALDDLAAAQDEADALRADLARYTTVYGDPDAPVDVAHMFALELTSRPATGSFPWGRDKVDALLRDHSTPFTDADLAAAIAAAPAVKVGDHVRCAALGGITGTVETIDPATPAGVGCLVRDDARGHVWGTASWLLEVIR